ncbi:MAG: cardiolipin synthase [Clostridiales bacterium]|nr:cardiolipin synthase [Clostridiales bacterium]
MKKVNKVKIIPPRLILAVFIFAFEILAMIGIVVFLCYRLKYFYLLAIITEACCVIKIIASDDNPDYKVPWLLVVLILPIAGFMLYFIFSSRKLKKRYVKRLKEVVYSMPNKDNTAVQKALKEEDLTAYNALTMTANISNSSIYNDANAKYFSDIEKLQKQLLSDIENANKFIFLEFFIIERGVFWDSILNALIKKAQSGVDIRVVYDDIGCLFTLPARYYKTLRKYDIKAVPFSRLKGSADSEFNNRSHRKIIVIDGKIGYTGGFNLADEYINKTEKFGHWKDAGIRFEGNAVFELTKTFFIDYYINEKTFEKPSDEYFSDVESKDLDGYIVPFSDGPKPIYKRQVGKLVIQNMLYSAREYVYITTPYLIIDNDLLSDIENTALRGVKVKIILPSIPDKKLVFLMSRSYYHRLLQAGVEIYEYTPGFIHAKTYVADGKYAMIGTVNLDYRSLVHHFENGVYSYNSRFIKDVESDFLEVEKLSKRIKIESVKNSVFKRFISAIVRVFSPLL